MKTTILTLCLAGIISLNGCFSVSVPELPALTPSVAAKSSVPVPVKPAACPKADKMVCPIVGRLKKLPKNAELKMVNGRITHADAGGRAIVGQYLGAFDAVEDQWRALPQ